MATTLGEKLAALETWSLAQLREGWRTAYKTDPPRLPPDLMRHGIAWRWQEKAHGGRGSRMPDLKVCRQSRPSLGTQLVRSWNGRTIAVTVCEGGYRWEDRSYASLSAIAREVTGAHWSGPRFFGMGARG